MLRIVIGALWLRSGLLKVVRKEYLEYRRKFENFASKNPFPWYRAFLLKAMVPCGRPAGYVFVTAELLLGALFVLGFLTVPAVLAAILLNLNFRLASGWRSPSNAPLNYLMIACELLILFSGAGSHFSLDALRSASLRP